MCPRSERFASDLHGYRGPSARRARSADRLSYAAPKTYRAPFTCSGCSPHQARGGWTTPTSHPLALQSRTHLQVGNGIATRRSLALWHSEEARCHPRPRRIWCPHGRVRRESSLPRPHPCPAWRNPAGGRVRAVPSPVLTRAYQELLGWRGVAARVSEFSGRVVASNPLRTTGGESGHART